MKENQEELQYSTNEKKANKNKNTSKPNQMKNPSKTTPKTLSLKKPEWPTSQDFSTEEGF